MSSVFPVIHKSFFLTASSTYYTPGIAVVSTLPSSSQSRRLNPCSLCRVRKKLIVDMASLLAQLTPAEKADPGVHHALQVAAAVATSNYARFFRLFSTAPNMSGYIMDHFVERERMSALATMSKA